MIQSSRAHFVLCAFFGAALLSVASPADAQFLPGCYQSCKNQHLADAQERNCFEMCSCIGHAIDVTLTRSEKFALALKPNDPRLAEFRQKCLRRQADRAGRLAKEAEANAKLSATACQSPKVSEYYRTHHLPLKIATLSLSEVDREHLSRYGFAVPTGAQVRQSMGDLSAGDVLLMVDGKPVTGPKALMTILSAVPKDGIVTICGLRQSPVVGRPAREFVVQPLVLN